MLRPRATGFRLTIQQRSCRLAHPPRRRLLPRHSGGPPTNTLYEERWDDSSNKLCRRRARCYEPSSLSRGLPIVRSLLVGVLALKAGVELAHLVEANALQFDQVVNFLCLFLLSELTLPLREDGGHLLTTFRTRSRPEPCRRNAEIAGRECGLAKRRNADRVPSRFLNRGRTTIGSRDAPAKHLLSGGCSEQVNEGMSFPVRRSGVPPFGGPDKGMPWRGNEGEDGASLATAIQALHLHKRTPAHTTPRQPTPLGMCPPTRQRGTAPND